MAGKVCSFCHTEKDLESFPSCTGHPEWRMGICRDCKRERDNKYSRLRNNKDREKVRSRNAKWVADNKEQVLIRCKKYRQEHKKELREKQKKCILNKIDQYREVARNRAARRRVLDLNFKLKDVLRKRLKNALHGLSKADRTMNLLGCSTEELRLYLEKQFSEGMSWDNYGLHGWHIDHKLPCCSFDLTKSEEQRRCFHYTNLQPLWARDNWAKGALDKQQKVA